MSCAWSSAVRRCSDNEDVVSPQGPQSLLGQRPPFRQLFFAHAISRAGDAFNTVALVVLVFRLTGSGLGVAGTVIFEVLPLVLFAPVAGLLVDRFPRRSVLV